MANSFVASKAQLIYALCLPLAVLMGYFLAAPTEFQSVAVILAVISLLLVPVLMKYYHPLLVFSWNAAITPYFIPGSPYIWMLLAIIGFGFAMVNRFTNPDAKLVEATWLNRSLGVMLLVVCATALLRGGIGVRSMGSATYGGKHYIYVVAAILGYFALISQRVPANKAKLYVAIFFLSSLTALVPNLAFIGGQSLYFLYYLFPAFLAQEQALAAYGPGTEFVRLTGLTFASMGFYCWLLARYGLRGIFDWKRPWRLLLFVLALASCLFTGFRSFLLLFLVTVCIEFVFEGLHRTRVMIVTLVLMLIALGVAIPNADKLPGVVQRSISFLPIEINPAIRQDVSVSSSWRWRMWQDISWEIPKYLLLGKGYSIDPSELDFAQENVRRGYSADYSEAMIAGDYHSGPLTLLIPFGIWGVAAFLMFLGTGWYYLWHQYRFGNVALREINRFILVFFTARIVYFFLIFGAFSFDLFAFTGLVGLSVSINGPLAAQEPPEEEDLGERDFESEVDANWIGM